MENTNTSKPIGCITPINERDNINHYNRKDYLNEYNLINSQYINQDDCENALLKIRSCLSNNFKYCKDEFEIFLNACKCKINNEDHIIHCKKMDIVANRAKLYKKEGKLPNGHRGDYIKSIQQQEKP